MIQIQSPQNPWIKELKKLKTNKGSSKRHQFFIEGLRFVDEAFLEGQKINALVVSNALKPEMLYQYEKKAEASNIPVYQLPDKLFSEITDTVSPQGIGAILPYEENDPATLLETVTPTKCLVLDCIQDPGNMGTIIRTADAFGFRAVFALQGCVDIYNTKVLRSTMGSIFRINLSQDVSPATLFPLFRTYHIATYGACLEGSSSLLDTNFQDKVCLVIGNEAKGIREEVLSFCESKIRIPMHGSIESLNASVAAGILMFEIYRLQNKSG